VTQAYNLTPVGNRVYFLESTGTRYTLWKSDGTRCGTVAVKTGIGTTSRPPYAFTAVNGQLYFANYADGTYRLWRSDGSGAGTVELKNFGNTYFLQPNQLTAVGNTLYFEANNALWRSQGTPSGTVNLRQIHSATDVLDPTEMRNANGVLFLAATNQAATTGLWRYLPPEESLKWLINTGGSSHYTAGGRLFAADTDQKAGGTLSRRVSGPVANTSEDELYRSNRHGSLLTYRFAVEPGTYDVTLHFCETYWGNLVPGGAGSRAFHVDMEGQRKLTDYDTYAKAGGAMRAVRETFRVTVADSVLTVTFRQGSADLAHVAALEVVQVKPPAATARMATETGAGLAVSLWPNPVHDRLTLRFGAAPGPASVTIADAAGRLHRAESRLRVHGEQAEVDVSSLPAGLYLLRVQAGSAHAVRKFVKE
jgi:ELWxxDGT repeat protein